MLCAECAANKSAALQNGLSNACGVSSKTLILRSLKMPTFCIAAVKTSHFNILCDAHRDGCQTHTSLVIRIYLKPKSSSRNKNDVMKTYDREEWLQVIKGVCQHVFGGRKELAGCWNEALVHCMPALTAINSETNLTEGWLYRAISLAYYLSR